MYKYNRLKIARTHNTSFSGDALFLRLQVCIKLFNHSQGKKRPQLSRCFEFPNLFIQGKSLYLEDELSYTRMIRKSDHLNAKLPSLQHTRALLISVVHSIWRMS